MNYSWSRISDPAALDLSQSNTKEYLSLSSTKGDSRLYQSAETPYSPGQRYQVSFSPNREYTQKTDIVPRAEIGIGKGARGGKKPRPPSFTDEMTTSSEVISRTPSKSTPDSKVSTLKRLLDDETQERQRAELLITQLRKRVAHYEAQEQEIKLMKSELKNLKEELKTERDQHKNLHEVRKSREHSQKEAFLTFERLLDELKEEVNLKTEEINRLRTTVKTSVAQRSELLKESELLRQTIAELKQLHRRETGELKAQLASECALRAAADRKLAEMYVTESPLRSVQLKSQVERLEDKLQDLEARHQEQAAISQDVQGQVHVLTSSMESRRFHIANLPGTAFKENNFEPLKSPPLTDRTRVRKGMSKSPLRFGSGKHRDYQ